MTLADKLSWGSTSLVLGLGAVFLILVLLIVFIGLMHRTSLLINRPKNKDKKTVPAPTDAQPVEAEDDEGELLAVIAAAIACMAQREGKKFKIKSYKRIRNNGSAWSRAGRIY